MIRPSRFPAQPVVDPPLSRPGLLDKAEGLQGDDALNAFHTTGLGDECMVLAYPNETSSGECEKTFNKP
jgi:hypothetical protein